MSERGDCGRCDGTGELPQFRHVQGGVCFRCEGSGNDPKGRNRSRPRRAPRRRSGGLSDAARRELRNLMVATEGHGGTTQATSYHYACREQLAELQAARLIQCWFDHEEGQSYIDVTLRGVESYNRAVRAGLVRPWNAPAEQVSFA